MPQCVLPFMCTIYIIIMYKTFIAVIMAIFWLPACHTEKASGPGEASIQHEDESSQYLLFSEGLEFFITHEALEVGVESHFLIHLTELSLYTPFATGHVSIKIDGVSVTSGKAEVPGIFEVPFTPKRAGAFDAEYTIDWGEASESVSAHVHVFENHDAIHAEDQHDHSSDALGEIAFSKEQAWKSDFMVKEVVPVDFSSVIATSGEILTVPGEKKNLAASSPGLVRFTNLNLVQGTPVKKDELLFTINSGALIGNNLQLQLQEAKNLFEKSRGDYLRHLNLFYKGAISERQIIDTRSRYTEDSLRYSILRSNVSGQGIQVKAPVTGTIHELMVSEGTYVETGQNMATISSNQRLMIRADLGQQFFDQLPFIETANFRPSYTNKTYTIEEMNGRLLAAGVSVAENDHYLPIIFEVENKGNLLEGAFTEVYLKTSKKQSVLAVPISAMTEEQGEFYVYTQVSGETYSKRAISPGKSDGLRIEILAGIEPGERVVTRGVVFLKAASMVTGVADHGHSH